MYSQTRARDKRKVEVPDKTRSESGIKGPQRKGRFEALTDARFSSDTVMMYGSQR